MNRSEITEFLQEHGIAFRQQEHPAAQTIEDIENYGLDGTETIAKNLFLRDDKKRNYYLVTVCKDKTVNLKELRTVLGSRPLSFASESDLQNILCLQRGAVTPLGLLNDDLRRVSFVLDRDITDFATVGVHPNENTATVWLAPSDLLALIREHGNEILIVQL